MATSAARKAARGLLLALALAGLACLTFAGGACRLPAAGGDEPGPGSGPEAVTPGEPGAGLPLRLPGGLLAFGLREPEPGGGGGTVMWLATIDSEGRNLTRRFSLHPDDSLLSLSPDGTRLVARRSPLGGEITWWLYDLAGGAVVELPIPPEGYITRVYWSGDSTRLAYMAMADSEAGTPERIGLVAVDGAEVTARATATRPSQGDGRMAWIPGSNAFLFVGNPQGLDRNLYVRNLDTGDERLVVRNVFCERLRVSPDGRLAAYYEGLMGGKVEIADLATGVKMSVKTYPATVTDLAWSPDGVLLAIVYSDTEAGPARLDIYSTVADAVTVTTAAIAEWQYLLPPNLTWSRDGRYVFLAGDVKGQDSLGVYRVDPRDGRVVRVFACGEDQSIRNLNGTP